MPDDPSSLLAEIRRRWRNCANDDVPRLLAAVEAALKLHQPHVRRQNWPPVCSYDNRRWPCPEVAAITTALGGTQPGKDGNHG